MNGTAEHAEERINFVVVAKSPIERIQTVARSRGWNHLRLLSSHGNTYNRDYYGEGPKGDQRPSLNIFVKRDGKIHHFYHTELLFAASEPGQDGRHVDLIWPLWNLFDFTPDGRGTKLVSEASLPLKSCSEENQMGAEPGALACQARG